MATIQISSVQRLVFESRKLRSSKTIIVKISTKKFLWYGKVNFWVGTMSNTFIQGKAFLGVSVNKFVHCHEFLLSRLSPQIWRFEKKNYWRGSYL